MLWSRKRKEMWDALTANEYPRKGEVHLMDYKLSSRVRSKDRPSPSVSNRLHHEWGLYGVRLFLKTEWCQAQVEPA